MADYDPEAATVAREWLGLADRDDAERTYALAAALFRAAVTPEQWARALSTARSPLGAVAGRTLRSGRAASELPGAPDGEYVVFEFETQFERKRLAVETVTPMREADGRWRVSGYYIR
jgi:Protein of unknown function (DUF4019)